MSFSSPVITRVVPDQTGAWSKRTQKVSRITLHHCAGYFDPSLRFLTTQSTGSSAHFMTNEEEIVLMNNPSTKVCWSDANASSNAVTVSIEMSNSSLAPHWTISEKTMQSTAKIMAELSRFYGLGTLVLGKNVFLHKEVSQLGTSCPGPFGSSNAQNIVNMANQYLNGNKPSSATSTNTFLVKVTADVLNVRQQPSTNSKVNTTVKRNQVYTITETNGEWGKLKSGAGWIHLDYIQKI